MNPATDDPVPEPPNSRRRLGDLLLSAGLITEEQLDESLRLARTAGKPLGHVLVERGLVPSHSIAMALADQHGGPLKTEFGFATGRGSSARPEAVPDQGRGAPPALRLASPSPEEPAQPAQEAADARVAELLARVDELQAALEAERAGRAAEAAALAANEVALAAVREELAAAAREAEPPGVSLDVVDELRAVIELQEQALATASARELSSTRSYSVDTHFLFAPSVDGYELLERSGAAPAPGEMVELSGGRTCRVLRIGPAPFPGASEACAYLELV